MTRQQLIIVIIAAVLVVAVLATTLGIYFGRYYDKNKGKYIEERAAYALALADCGFFENKDSVLPSTIIEAQMYSHFSENTSGKKPMLLFIGYDGCLAAGLKVLEGKENSAVFSLKEEGGAYLTHTGGEDVTKHRQNTSTAPGWATIFTGKWATESKVVTNGDVLSRNTKSIMLKLAEQGIAGSFSVSWKPHISRTYRREVKAVKKNQYPFNYILSDDDNGTRASVESRLASSADRAIFCILEYNDHEGHTSGFSMSNEKYVQSIHDVDEAAYALIQKVRQRPTYSNEDWMIVLASDHGGAGTGHGGGTIMEYTTFYVTNKAIK